MPCCPARNRLGWFLVCSEEKVESGIFLLDGALRSDDLSVLEEVSWGGSQLIDMVNSY